jgi:uncharacterized protein YybS (DUF2232 family)
MIVAIIQLLVAICILGIQTAIYLSLRNIVGEPLQWRKPKNDNRYL